MNPQPNEKQAKMNDDMARAMMIVNTFLTRSQLQAQLGYQYGTERDMYEALGYKRTPTFEDFEAMYDRQDIAKTIIDIPADGTWKGEPCIEQVGMLEGKVDSPFEIKFQQIANDLKLWTYFNRVDKISQRGEYAVLFLGFDDAKDFKQLKNPVSENTEGLSITHIRPISQPNAQISKFNSDPSSSRFQQPEIYTLTFDDQSQLQGSTDQDTKSKSVNVHWSRVLHIASDLQESDIYGTPTLKAILNRLFDLEKVVGGNSEAFWRGAYPATQFDLDPDVQLSPKEKEELRDQTNDFINKFKRTIRTRGMDIKEFSAQAVDPSGAFDVIMKLISAKTRIPMRMLTGSERGELSSSQDMVSFNEMLLERKEDFATPCVIKPFIDRLIKYGILPPVEYTVTWHPVTVRDAEKQSVVTKNLTESIVKYSESLPAQMIVQPKDFFTRILGLSITEAETLLEEMDGQFDDEEEDDEFDFEIIEKEQDNEQTPDN